METDKERIKAISTWTTNHSKGKKEYIPSIALKYLGDLLEYIEDMELLALQAGSEQIYNEFKNKIRKELEKELDLIQYRIEDGYVEEKIQFKCHRYKIEYDREFQSNLYTDKHAQEYLKVIPVKSMFKAIFKRMVGEEEE